MKIPVAIRPDIAVILKDNAFLSEKKSGPSEWTNTNTLKKGSSLAQKIILLFVKEETVHHEANSERASFREESASIVNKLELLKYALIQSIMKNNSSIHTYGTIILYI